MARGCHTRIQIKYSTLFFTTKNKGIGLGLTISQSIIEEHGGLVVPLKKKEKGATIVLYHHERYDGKGYPKGLKGKQIPFPARLFAIIDAYDAMTTKRCYRDKLSPEEAIEEITRQKDKQFDPSLVDLLIPHFMTLKQDGYLDNL